jgi:hypothetical protein
MSHGGQTRFLRFEEWLFYVLPDERTVATPRRFLIDVDETIRVVLEQEDTDGDFQVSNSISHTHRQMTSSTQ